MAKMWWDKGVLELEEARAAERAADTEDRTEGSE